MEDSFKKRFIEEIDSLEAVDHGEVIAYWSPYWHEDTGLDQLPLRKMKFLSLLREKMKGDFLSKMHQSVKAEFAEWYDEDSFDEEISLQSFDLDDLDQGQWQLMFEDDSEDPLVHVYFDGWKIDYLVVTG